MPMKTSGLCWIVTCSPLSPSPAIIAVSSPADPALSHGRQSMLITVKLLVVIVDVQSIPLSENIKSVVNIRATYISIISLNGLLDYFARETFRSSFKLAKYYISDVQLCCVIKGLLLHLLCIV